MDVYRQGKKVRLTPAEFKAQGGEGAVYVAGNTAYKIYADPAKMIPTAKIRELSVLDRPGIVRPEDVLLDRARTPVGYTMSCVPNALALCATFTPAFRQRTGLTPEKMLHLVRELRDGVAFVHSKGVLIVDLNEMNFLVDPAFGTVYFIDVDSYQTPHFPATALMDSVRDRRAAGAWTPGTDWFSFAVVSFQMLMGIHPYKGKHPSVKTLDERMAQEISVFHPGVSLPSVCPPLSALPSAYRAWYEAVFEQGERSAPPPNFGAAAIAVYAAPTVSAGQLSITLWRRLNSTIAAFTRGFCVTSEAVYDGDRRVCDAPAGAQIGVTPQTHTGILASLHQGCLRLQDLTRGTVLSLALAAEEIMAADGRLYLKQGGSLLELSFVETAAQIWASAKIVGTVLEHATQIFEGVALQNLVGAWYASLLPEAGRCRQVRLPELDGFQIVSAKFEGGVLMVVAAHSGRFSKFIFRFAGDYSAYDLRVTADVATYGVNFVVLDSGLCLHLTGDGDLEVFPAKHGASALKVLADPALGGDGLLLRDGSAALLARGSAVFRLAMR